MIGWSFVTMSMEYLLREGRIVTRVEITIWLYGVSVGIQDDLRERCSIGLLLKKLVCLLVKAG